MSFDEATIKRAMKNQVDSCRDKFTDEVNYTLLAETVTSELGQSLEQDEYDSLLERCFDLAVDF